MSRPAYIALLASGELAERAQQLQAILRDCTLCPRCCHANRLQGEIGKCRSTAEAIISSAGPHFGEEPELVGLGGSGTIFFTNCNLWCLFCQNYEISHLKMGLAVSAAELAKRMLYLQSRGCHNINLVKIIGSTCVRRCKRCIVKSASLKSTGGALPSAGC